jgi:hypothetical protein
LRWTRLRTSSPAPGDRRRRRGGEGARARGAGVRADASWISFPENSTRRTRQRLFEAYINRGNHDDEHDNKILSRIAALR